MDPSENVDLGGFYAGCLEFQPYDPEVVDCFDVAFTPYLVPHHLGTKPQGHPILVLRISRAVKDAPLIPLAG